MRAALMALGLLSLTSCGVNLFIIKQELRLTSPDGASHNVRVVMRPEHGMMQPDFDASFGRWLSQAAFAVLFEPLDLIASTAIAVDAMFDPNHDVAGGPIGWLAAMTPFATLVPELLPSYFFFGRPIDAPQWQQLSSDDEADRRAAARQIWPDRNITYVHPAVAVAAENAPGASGGN